MAKKRIILPMSVGKSFGLKYVGEDTHEVLGQSVYIPGARRLDNQQLDDILAWQRERIYEENKIQKRKEEAAASTTEQDVEDLVGTLRDIATWRREKRNGGT
tara:strand:- start:408 stop:713 length:306 start_codon:yes stop_codon:yes gene_type:complete